MEEQIVAYLETYGQPQTIAAIADNVAQQDAGNEVDADTGLNVHAAQTAARLDQMAAAGTIWEVRAGVHANGEQTLEYAPLSFSA